MSHIVIAQSGRRTSVIVNMDEWAPTMDQRSSTWIKQSKRGKIFCTKYKYSTGQRKSTQVKFRELMGERRNESRGLVYAR